MSKDVKVVAKKTLKVAGALAAGAGVIAISALVASGAAVGAVAEGFKSAKKAAKKVLNENEDTEVVETENFSDDEVLTEETEVSETEIVQEAVEEAATVDEVEA